MTLFQMIERVKMVYPDASETDIAQYLNDSLKEFVEETKLQTRSLAIDLIADENVYPIPPDCSAIKTIDFYDTTSDLPRNVVSATFDVDNEYIVDTYGNLVVT